MILENLGVLSTAQDLSNGAADSENVIDLGTVANVALESAHLVVTCETAEGASGSTSSFKFALVIASEATLDTTREVLSMTITGASDPRIAAAGRKIMDFDVGQMLGELVDGTYRYLGLISTLSDGNGTATVSINADLAPSRGRTKDNVQVVRSNVGVPS